MSSQESVAIRGPDEVPEHLRRKAHAYDLLRAVAPGLVDRDALVFAVAEKFGRTEATARKDIDFLARLDGVHTRYEWYSRGQCALWLDPNAPPPDGIPINRMPKPLTARDRVELIVALNDDSDTVLHGDGAATAAVLDAAERDGMSKEDAKRALAELERIGRVGEANGRIPGNVARLWPIWTH